jgi:hypothetical protein
MDREYDFDGVIRAIVQEEMRYLKHYWAKVENNVDPDGKGKVLVTIPVHGWDSQEKGQWAIPRYPRGLSIPAVGKYVEVYFINGNVDTLAYTGDAMELKDMLPKNFVDKSTHVIWECPDDENQVIKYDANQKQMDIKSDNIILNEGTESFVLGDMLDTWINNILMAVYNGHKHICSAPTVLSGVPDSLITAPTNYLSENIKGK